MMWTERQRLALDALNIPRYVLKTTPTPCVPTADVANTANAPQISAVFYQLGPWVLEFSLLLPVESFPWLQDLSHVAQAPLVQISDAGHQSSLNCQAYAKPTLTAAEKRALWQQLQAYFAA